MQHTASQSPRVLLPLAVALSTAFLLLFCVFADEAKSIQLKSPKNGATVSRTATFVPRLTKSLQKRTNRIEVWVGSRRVAVDRKAPFKARLDTRRLADGSYTFRVKAVLRQTKRAATSRLRAKTKVVSRRVKVKVLNKARRPAVQPGRSATGSQNLTPPAAPAPAAPATDPRIEQITGGESAPGESNDSGWKLTFADEFDGDSLDDSKWNWQRDDWIKGGFPHNILEGAWYEQANNTVEDGVLKQTIKRLETPMTPNPEWGTYKYTTGMVNTNKRFGFTYGYVEARMRVPSCSGCWPAFWMLPTEAGWPPEIDIYEFFDTAKVKFPYFSTHWKVPDADQDYITETFGTPGGNYTEAWHTYGMLWTPDSVQIFLDGVPGPVHTGKSVPQEDMYLIIQAAIGRDYATPDGASLQTDYVRVYQQQD